MPDVRIVASPAELAEVGATEVLDRFERAGRAGRSFHVALAGGRTPRGVYERLAALAADGRRDVDWSRAHVFWGDERAVPPDDDESNYRMAREALLARVPIPERQVHRIEAERPDAAAAAGAYERDIRETFHLGAGEWPRFDLVILGLGGDGHVASLFPDTSALSERRRLAVSTYVPRLEAHRITLTFPVFNHAACVLFLVSGSGKASVLRSVLHGDDGPDRYPAQRIQPENGSVLWLVDRAAAARISVHA